MDFTIFIDQECGPVRSLIFLSHEFFQAPNSECVVHQFIFIAGQVKTNGILFNEFHVFRGGIRTDSENFDTRLLKRIKIFGQIARLCGTAWSHIAGIKIDGKLFSYVMR